MGIERFFSSIKKEFNIIINTEYPFTKIHTKYFMIDFNSIVHILSAHMISTINNYLIKNKPNCPYKYDTIENFEKNLLDIIGEYLINMLKYNIYANELNYLVICIDGVPTMAKIYEQKKRRYMGHMTSFLTSKIDLPFNWAKNNISPGTNFMKQLQDYLRSKDFTLQIKNTCKNLKEYIISDTTTPGEGEMKIVNYIKSMNKHQINLKDDIVVYSPDSDMLILLLLLDNNTTILRYDQQKSKLNEKLEGKKYSIINVNKFRKILLDYIKKTVDHFPINEKRLINDIIFIFTVFGDDFLPKLEPFRVNLDIYIILDYYLVNLIRSGYLLEKNNGLQIIRTTSFLNFFTLLSKQELLFLNRNSKHSLYSNYHRVELDIFGTEMFKFRELFNEYIWKFMFINKKFKKPCASISPTNVSKCFDIKLFIKFLNKEEPLIDNHLLENFAKRKFEYTDKDIYHELKKSFMANYLHIIKQINNNKLYSFIKNNNLISKRNGLFKNYGKLYYLMDTKENFLDDILYYMFVNLEIPITGKLQQEHPKLLEISYRSDKQPHKKNIDSLDNHELLQYKIEYKLDEYYNILNPTDLFYQKFFNTGFPEREEIEDYYQINFGSLNKSDIIKEYLFGLNWVVNYYFNGIVDKTWYYFHRKSPLLYDIINNYSHKILRQQQIDKYTDKTFITPLEQLIFISPININKDIMSQLSLLNKIVSFKDMLKIVNFIKEHPFYFFDLEKIYNKLMKGNEIIVDCSTSIFLNKCHLVFLENKLDLDRYLTDFRNYFPINYQRKYYPLNVI